MTKLRLGVNIDHVATIRNQPRWLAEGTLTRQQCAANTVEHSHFRCTDGRLFAAHGARRILTGKPDHSIRKSDVQSRCDAFQPECVIERNIRLQGRHSGQPVQRATVQQMKA